MSTSTWTRPLPVLRDKNGQIIHEHDILRVFHFYGRRRGRGREKHYMYKIAIIKDWPNHGRQWWFHHTAALGEGLTNGYCPYNQKGEAWGTDETLPNVEVIDSPATLHAQFCKGRPKCRRDGPTSARSSDQPFPRPGLFWARQQDMEWFLVKLTQPLTDVEKYHVTLMDAREMAPWKDPFWILNFAEWGPEVISPANSSAKQPSTTVNGSAATLQPLQTGA